MKKYLSMVCCLIVLLLSSFSLVSEVSADFNKLSKRKYKKFKDEKAVVVYGVNWGKQWGCAGFENAQLQELTFTRIDSEADRFDNGNIKLKVSSKLLAKNISIPKAIIVSPGKYALSGFDVKLAKSQHKTRHIIGDISNLFESGKPVGGTFYVNAGEIVYIGDFGLDCAYEPIPWRYYIEKEDFEEYVDGFRKKYKFIDNKKMIYRLFQTTKFGQ